MGSNGLYTKVSVRPNLARVGMILYIRVSLCQNLARVGMILYKSVSVSEFSMGRNDIIQDCLCV